MTTLIWAIDEDYPNDIIKLIIQQTKETILIKKGILAIARAFEKKNYEIAKFLISKDIKYSIRDFHEYAYNDAHNNLHGMIISAVVNNQIEFIAFLLSQGVKCNYKGYEQETLLMTSIKYKNHEISKLLIATYFTQNEDIDECNISGETALYLASEYGYIEIVQLLLNHHSNPNKCMKGTNKNALNIAMINKHYEIAKLLILNGAKINKEITDLAISEECIEIVESLLQKGENPDRLLLDAAELNKITIAKFLLTKATDLNFYSMNGGNVLSCFADNGHMDLLKQIFSSESNSKITLDTKSNALISAIMQNHTELAKFILRQKVNVNYHKNDGYNQTPLSAAAHQGNIDIALSLIKKQAKFLKSTLSSTTNDTTNDTTPYPDPYETALLSAKIYNHGKDIESKNRSFRNLFIAKLFLQRGRHCDEKIKNNYTAIIISTICGDVKMTEYLISIGANLEARGDNDEKTALICALQYKKFYIIRLLLEGGARTIDENPTLIRSSYKTKINELAQGMLLLERRISNDDNNKKAENAFNLVIAYQQHHIKLDYLYLYLKFTKLLTSTTSLTTFSNTIPHLEYISLTILFDKITHHFTHKSPLTSQERYNLITYIKRTNNIITPTTTTVEQANQFFTKVKNIDC